MPVDGLGSFAIGFYSGLRVFLDEDSLIVSSFGTLALPFDLRFLSTDFA